MTISSFDIFDTTLYRKCGEAENVFELLALRLYPNNEHKRDSFYAWRCTSAINVHEKYGKSATIDDIYNDYGLSYFIEYSPDYLKKTEFDIETEMLTINNSVLNIISEARGKGDTIAFISDMYLPSKFICEILRREGAFFEGDYIYVSCEHNASKSDGDLFDIVNRELHPHNWKHYGDNDYCDIKVARKKGIIANKIDIPYHNVERELKKISTLHRQNKEISTLAGFSRYLRLSHGNDSKAILGADFVAPCYVSYMIHVLNDAKKGTLRHYSFFHEIATFL